MTKLNAKVLKFRSYNILIDCNKRNREKKNIFLKLMAGASTELVEVKGSNY